MKINKIVIENFRSYFGVNPIEFSIDPDKPITMIIGTNGGGKSSLMNAIQWCLFNRLMPGTDDPEILKHKDCASNERYGVQLEFNQNGQNYKLLRGWNPTAGNYFAMFELNAGGDLGDKIESPERALRKILPEELKDWFFYNAEKKVDTLNLDGSPAFKSAMRQIQGFTLIDQFIDDLSKVEKRKHSELQRQSNNKAVSDLRKQIDELETQAEPLKRQLDELEGEIIGLKNGRNTFSNQLREIPKTKPLEEERTRLEGDKARLKSSLRKKEEEKILFLGKYLPAILLKSLVNARSDKIPQEKEKEIIVQFPHGNELFANIEKKGICICGRPVLKGSIEELNLNALKSDAIKPSFNNRVAGLNLTISEIDSLFGSFEDELSKRDIEIKADNEAIKAVEERLEEIEAAINKLAGTDEKVKAIEDKLNEINDQIDLNNSLIGSKNKDLRDINSKISALNIEITAASNIEAKSEGLELFLSKIDRIKNYAISKLARDEKTSLNLILIELNKLIEKYLYANVFAQINPETYEVKCYEAGSKEKKILSTGEFELLKYLFISTILGLASKKTQAKLKYLTPPTSFPLIMDAPFTAMDTDFLQGAVDTITNKLEQVILLALPSAFIEYEDLIKDKLGKKYLVVKADKLPKSKSKEDPKKYRIFGEDQDFVVYDNNVNGKPISQTIVRPI